MNATDIRLQAAHCRDRAEALRTKAFMMSTSAGLPIFNLAEEWEDQAARLERRLKPRLVKAA